MMHQYVLAGILLFSSQLALSADSDICDFDFFTDMSVLLNEREVKEQTFNPANHEHWFRLNFINEMSQAEENGENTVEGNYDIIVTNVGSDIDVALYLYNGTGNLIAEEDFQSNGKDETMVIRNRAGIHYLRVRNIGTNALSTCQQEVKYQVTYIPASLESNSGNLMGNRVFDIFSGVDIPNVRINGEHMEGICRTKNDDSFSCDVLKLGSNIFTIEPETGNTYHPLRCDIWVLPTMAGGTEQDFPLIPTGIEFPKLVTSQSVYRGNDMVSIQFPFRFPFKSIENVEYPDCGKFYVGIAYPDGNLYLVKNRNELHLLPDLQQLSSQDSWHGDKGYSSIIERSVSTFPKGKYTVYSLFMPQFTLQDDLDSVMKHIGEGVLSVSEFTVE